jgi:hypothetical protein
VAVLAVCAALSTYSVALSRTPTVADRDRGIAKPTLERVTEFVDVGGTVIPERVSSATRVGPDGYRVRVTLLADGRNWTAGPEAPESAESATRPVSVRRDPGEVVTGRLRVEVWT